MGTCVVCQGTGRVRCPTCRGQGVVGEPYPMRIGKVGIWDEIEPCWSCPPDDNRTFTYFGRAHPRGRGWHTCTACRGQGLRT